MPGKPKLSDISRSIPDPCLSDNFQLSIPNLPTGDSAIPFLMQCRTASKPGVTLNVVEVQVFGHTLEHAGNKTYGHDMSVEYVENRMMEITRALEKWANFVRDTQTQHGAYKSEYARNGVLTVFDQKGEPVVDYVIVNMWPSVVPDASFDGTSSTAISVGMTFKYDYYYDKTNNVGSPSATTTP